MISRFSELVADFLRNAGWRQGRRVDISQIRALLESKGIAVSSAAEEFLAEFHGLVLVSPDRRWAKFDVVDAVPWYEPGEIARLESIVASSLCLIGTGNVGNLLISQAGEVFGLDYCWRTISRSRNVPEFFDTVCGIRPSYEITDCDKNRVPYQTRTADLGGGEGQ
jgi:hypothetical protein